MKLKIEILKKEEKIIESLLKSYPFKPYFWLKKISPDKLLNYIIFDIKRSLGEKGNFLLKAKYKKEIKGLALFKILPWDTEYFGFKVGKIEYLIADGEYEESYLIKKELVSFLLSICEKQKFKFLSFRCPTAELSSVHALEENGFKLVTSELMFAWEKEKIKNYQWDKIPALCEIRAYQEGDLIHLLKIASFFTTNRFYADPKIPQTQALGVYKFWIENACSGTFSGDDEVLVGIREGEIVGFTTTKIEKNAEKTLGIKIGIPGLVGVFPKFRGLGINPYLISQAIISLFKKVEVVAAPSHITNLTMIKSESKAGAELVATEYIFHKWL